MIKNTLLALALLLPMLTVAKMPTVQESPIPDCYPCNVGPSLQPTKPVVKDAPIPDCFPCPRT